jgi:hypothetical protein
LRAEVVEALAKVAIDAAELLGHVGQVLAEQQDRDDAHDQQLLKTQTKHAAPAGDGNEGKELAR